MTILAYRNGVLAFDTLVSGNDYSVGHMNKCINVNGVLAGVCGNATDIQRVKDWMIGRMRDDLALCEDSHAILIRPDGLVLDIFQQGFIAIERRPFYAWGSGEMVALGSMAAGASATEACRAATKFVQSCGGEIRYLTHEPNCLPKVAFA